MSALDILLVILRIAFGAFVPLSFVAVLVWMERRGAAFFQDRAGPNRCNVLGFRAGGLIQNAADGIKLAFKEDIIPGHVKHKFYFILAPMLVFITALLCFAVIPFADVLILGDKHYMMQAVPMDIGILWFLAVVGFGVYGIILAGWSSHNKYGMLGGLRAAAQVISYEIPMGLALVSLLAVYGTVNLSEMAQFQGRLLFGFIPMWGFLLQPLGVIIFIVAAFAETNRTPFDLAEGESEIVAGYHVEYSSMKFALFFMGEYVAMFVSSALIVTLYFGSYQIPWFTTQTLVTYARLLLRGVDEEEQPQSLLPGKRPAPKRDGGLCRPALVAGRHTRGRAACLPGLCPRRGGGPDSGGPAADWHLSFQDLSDVLRLCLGALDAAALSL
jgi:NADH-quinone oxidoreductase subunit H